MRYPTILLYLFLSMSCSNKVQPPPVMDKAWTLNSNPNALDVVGLIFAIDENGNYKSIPGGTLDVKVVTSPLAMTETTKLKKVSLGLLVNFLALKNIDSLASAKVYDSTKLTAAFTVNQGILSRIDDDLRKAFDQRRSMIESNIDILGLDKSRLFIILETIQSPNINIVLNRNTNLGLGVNARVKEIIKANLEANPNVTDNSSMVYQNSTPVTVFYKLHSINVFKIKGDAKVKYELELGSPVVSMELKVNK